MPDSSAAIVIDMGTTNCKVSCFSCQDATRLGSIKFATPKCFPTPGAVDFDIEQLWQEVMAAIARLAASSPLPVSCISIASFGESGVFIDDNDKILTPMLAWYDRRGEEYLPAFNDAERARLYAISGLPLHSNYSAFKMRWLLDNFALRDRDDIRWLHAPEVLLWRLTGEKKTEMTLASRTLCLDLRQGCWSREAAGLFNIPIDVFAPLLAPGEIAGWLTDQMRRQLGFAHPVSVTLAGHDHMVGARALRMNPGEVINSTGTSEGILLLNDQPLLSPQAQKDKLANGRYSQPDRYTLFASLPVSGFALEWMKGTFRFSAKEIADALEESYQHYLSGSWQMEEIPLFIPHLRGSGSPYKSRHTRGLLYGLADTLPATQLVASVSLGLALEFAHCFACFSVANQQPVKVIGPACENPLWLQLKADLLARPFEAIALEEAVSVGALLTACPELTLPTAAAARYQPDEKRSAALRRYQQRWLAFYRFKLQQEGVLAEGAPP
ncbi:carbohydrate kinase [Izhakiella australiensis]|uniref:Carbohydrate kinase n=1 Tax=Izhakiella australiensis TaxID=1926881 RepID=A0A1S8YDU5_9GAMM|nr:FGGY-family carbohydrate kinase [Izhakiella australiensis]OON36992.1 carbohydrate kinase [Izhakiella australiensis]